MKKLLLAPLFLFFMSLLSPLSQAQKIRFLRAGKEVQSIDLSILASALKVSPQSIEVWEPHLQRRRHYRAYPLKVVLENIYGKEWQNSEEILFTCSDGYQPSLPLKYFQKFSAYLAFAVDGEKVFEIDNPLQNEKHVALAPLYLVWDNIRDPALKDEGAGLWPYQIVGFDLIQFRHHFPKMSPPEGASASVQRGFLAYRKHCMSCHAMNGEGGGKAGVDLNQPENVLSWMDEKKLRAWILNPPAIKPGTTMPALGPNPFYKNQKDLVDDLVSYFAAMKKNKN